MKYRCEECGWEFFEPASITENHGITDGGFEEHFSVCPNCGGDYEELNECDRCGKEMAEGELYNGLCADCVRNSITYATGYKYLTSGAKCDGEADLFESFMFEQLGVGDYPSKRSSAQLKALLKQEYDNRVRRDEMLKLPMFAGHPKMFDFLEDIRGFIMDDGSGVQDFADWLEEQEGKK